MPATETALTVTSATSIVVTNTNDDGPGSLRKAIVDAPAGATIRFHPSITGQSIAVTTTELSIDKALTIEGPQEGITLSGDSDGSDGRPVITAMDASPLVLQNMTISGGRFGGIFQRHGVLILEHSTITGNTSLGRDTGGILSHGGSVTLINSTISGNQGASSVGGARTRSGSGAGASAPDHSAVQHRHGSNAGRGPARAGQTTSGGGAARPGR